jgi:hypothetical protein
MKIVISCAGRKVTCAKRDGYMQTKDGKPVMFVAQPLFAPKCDNVIYKTPDDLSDDGQASWRTRLQEYNKSPGDNPWKLYKAYMLYRNKTYGDLAKRFSDKNVYILSAGWGLIRADFLTPQYNITFSPGATGKNRYKHREFVKTDPYFNFLPDDDGPIVFLGGKTDYVRLFCWLTEKYRSCRIVYYYSKRPDAKPPEVNGCKTERFESEKPRTWYYECAKDFIEGKITY